MIPSDVPRELQKLLDSRTAPAEFDVDEQMQMLWHLLDLADVGVFWKDLEGKYLGGNAMFLDLIGVDSVADVVGLTDYDFFEHEDASIYSARDAKVMGTKEPLHGIEAAVQSYSGKRESMSISKMPIQDVDGDVVGLMACFRFVTQEVKTEQALKTLQGRFAMALDKSPDAVWEFELASRTFEVAPRLWELLDVEPWSRNVLTVSEISELFGSKTGEFGRVVSQVVRGKTEEFTINYPYKLKNGSTRWLSIEGLPFRSDDGAVTHLIGSVADETAKVEQEAQLRHRASHDFLTGLPNRAAFLEKLTETIDSQTPASVLFLDLDDFKVINDSLGHQVGDELLQAMAHRLDSLCRDGQVLARLGGDEFGLVTPNCSLDTAVGMGERILEALAEPVELNQTEMYVTCSIGVLHVDGQYKSSTGILRDGDIALYSAKRNGRSCVRKFEPWMGKEADALLDLQNRVRRAVSQQEFTLHYQPVVNNTDGSLSGVEALMRWQPEDGQLLYPDSFLDYLEHTGLIKEVGEWVIREALAQLASWRREYSGAHDCVMSINISRVQFRSAHLGQRIIEALKEHDIAPSQLVVEVTETAITEDFETLVSTLRELREHGVHVAIDDFGVGQSSLNALYETPADVLKIDRAFISRIEAGKPQPMVDAIVAIARSAGLAVVAEGIETESQDSYVKHSGCEFSQGYLFSRPISPEEIADNYFK